MHSTSTIPESLFPPEVWGTVSRFLDVREVCRLYLGSNRAIQRALHAGVTHLVDWADVPFPTRFSYFPAQKVCASFVSHFSYLECLHLPYNTNLTDEDMLTMLSDHVTYIDLSCNEELTDVGLSQLPPFLVTLTLKFSPNITDATLKQLPKTLKHLDLDRCKHITDVGIANLPPKLETLSITFARKITDEGIARLPKTLMQLQLAMNKTITLAGVRELPDKLQILDLSHNTNLAHSSREDFPPHLKVLLTL